MPNARSIATLVVCFALSLPAFAADELRMVPIFRHGTMYYAPSYDVAPADLDGDGVTELVLCEAGGPLALGARDGGYVVEWKGAPLGCQAMAVGDRDRDGGLEVVVTVEDRLMIFDPRGLSGPFATITLPDNAVEVALGNVDGDAAGEIVVLGSSDIWVYDAETLALQWSADGYGGSSVRIADIDGNSVPEIVVNGSTASVLDAVTETQKWGYVGGFGVQWDTGNVDADAKEEIVFYDDGVMTVLSGDTFGTVTWPGTGGEYYGFHLDDGDRDGTDEIIAGRYPGLIAGYRAADGVEVWSVPVTGYGANKILLANLDTDSSLEVVTTSASYNHSVKIIDRTTGVLEWASPDTDSANTFRLVTGDLDGDGRLENVVSSRSGGSTPGRGKIEVFDAATHALKLTIPVPENDYYGFIENLAIAQADADPAMEIVAIIYESPHVLMSWDGVTGNHEFTSNTGPTNLLRTLTVANVDGDALDELIVGTDDNKLLILNGASNFVQKSLQLTGDLIDVALADLNGDSDLELVTASYWDQVTVYDMTTWATLGSASISNVTDIDATSAGGGTIVAVSYYYGLHVYKGATVEFEYGCGTSNSYYVAAFGDIVGETRLIAATRTGELALFPLAADSCPTPLPAGRLAATAIVRLEAADATGDGRNDLLVSSQHAAHVALLGVSSETRGDVDGDELITVDDVDAVTDYLLAGAAGLSPSADANADERLGVEDLFLLIDHEFGSGAELQP